MKTLYTVSSCKSFEVFGRQFVSEYAAHRFATEDLLRQTLHTTGVPPVSISSKKVLASDTTRRAEAERETIDHVGEDLRAWLLEHVHTLLPILQALADTHPPVTEDSSDDDPSRA